MKILLDTHALWWFYSGSKELSKTAITQPALFIFELALAKLWMSWGRNRQAFNQTVYAPILSIFRSKEFLLHAFMQL